MLQSALQQKYAERIVIVNVNAIIINMGKKQGLYVKNNVE